MKGTNRKIINIVGKQEELMKRFKDSNEFFDNTGLGRSNIYFKIGLYKFLCKYPKLKNSTVTASYFKSNFKMIKKICKTNLDAFSEKKVKIFLSLFSIFSILVWLILSSLESFIHEEFYSWKILSGPKNLIVDLYPARRLFSSA